MSALNLKEIDWAISELEQEESSKQGCILLASLYTIRDHMAPPDAPNTPNAEAYSFATYAPPESNSLDYYGSSDFLQAIAGKDPEKVWNIIDDLMDTLQAVNTRVYDSVLRKIREL